MSSISNDEFRIIKERFDRKMEEEDDDIQEYGTIHNSKGHFTSKDDPDARVYSITNAAKSVVKDKSKIKRGKYNPSTGKISSPFGMNTSKDKQCGRKKMDGSDQSPKFSCSKYNARYENLDVDETNEPFLKIKIGKSIKNEDKINDSGIGRTNDNLSRAPNFKLIDVIAALKTMIEQNPEEMNFISKQFNKLGYIHRSQLERACGDAGFLSRDQYLQWTNNQALAAKGELNRSPKK